MSRRIPPAGITPLGKPCNCRCHSQIGVRHMAACCSPERRPNLENYGVVRAEVVHGTNLAPMAHIVELIVCKQCGLLVGDMEIHDTDHERRTEIATRAVQAYGRSHAHD